MILIPAWASSLGFSSERLIEIYEKSRTKENDEQFRKAMLNYWSKI